MIRILIITLFLTASVACGGKVMLRNTTAARGYARGEAVRLGFASIPARNSPDSIEVTVIEKKTGYHYRLRAGRGDCGDSCAYSATWDGRKENGSWPAGGRYLVFARLSENSDVYSDTTQIGLGD